MLNEDYLKLKCEEGEGFKVEFKEKLSQLDREIVAFANASGGEIYLGVDDEGKIKGITLSNTLVSQVQDIAQNCDPSIRVHLKKYIHQKVLLIQIEEGNNKPYKCKDGFFLRVGPNSHKLKHDEIIKFINDVGKIHFDESYNQHFTYPKDFSKEAFEKFIKCCGYDLKASMEEILISLNCAKKTKDQLKMMNVGVLFFSKNPQYFFPEAYITAVRYQNNDRYAILDKKDFKGTLLNQIEDAIAFVIRHMNIGAHFKDFSGTARKVIYDYPPGLSEKLLLTQ